MITTELSQTNINSTNKMTAIILTGNYKRYENNSRRCSRKCIGKKITVHILHVKAKFVKIPNLHNSSIKYTKTIENYVYHQYKHKLLIHRRLQTYFHHYLPIQFTLSYTSRCSSTTIHPASPPPTQGSTALVDLGLLINGV